MKSWIKVGLVVGVVSACPAALVSASTCCVAPVLLAFVGGAAGYLAAGEEPSADRDQRAMVGAAAAGTAGAIVSTGMVLWWAGAAGLSPLGFFAQTGGGGPADTSALVGQTCWLGAAALFLLAFAVAAGAVCAYLSNPPAKAAAREGRSDNVRADEPGSQ